MTDIYIPQGVPVALFLTNSLNFPGSYDVKTKAYSNAFYVYVPTLACSPFGLSARIDDANIKKETQRKKI